MGNFLSWLQAFASSFTNPLLCLLLTSVSRSNPIAQASVRSMNKIQISRGKTLSFHCVDAEFIKYTSVADGGLNGHVPTGPTHITPQIRFLYITPQFWIGLPSDPTSR